IRTARHDPLAIRAKSKSGNRAVVYELVYNLAAGDAPESNRIVKGTRRKSLLSWTKSDERYAAWVGIGLIQLLACPRVPTPGYFFIGAGASQDFAAALVEGY